MLNAFAILILNTDKVREYAESLYEMEYTLDDTVAEGESSPRHLRTQSDDFKKEEMVTLKIEKRRSDARMEHCSYRNSNFYDLIPL